jgi:hypothetical protein
VRQQDLPVLNGDHANPGAKSPTTVFPGEAIGWVQDLRMKDPDTLVAEVDFNALGEELVAQKRFKYVSPELLRDYTDAESGRKYRLVAAGLDCSSDNRSMCAVTNFPRIKRLGRIAANEAGVEAWALRFGEVTADTPGHALRMKLEEDDGGEPDTAEDALATPCNWAPPNSSVGRCPGYTRGAGLMDGDGDQPGDTAGCCMLADRCNGYSPVSANGNGNSYVGLMSEGERHMGEHDENGANPGGTSGGVTDPVPPPSTANADAAETRNLLTAAEQRQTKLAEELATERRKREELEARLNAAERAKVIDAYRTRVDRLRDSNRITPAVHEKLAANESLLRFREDGRDPFLDALEQLPGTAIPMQEIGSGGDADHGTVDQGRLVVRMNELFAERSKGNPRYTYQDAAKAAADEVFGVRKGTQ